MEELIKAIETIKNHCKELPECENCQIKEWCEDYAELSIPPSVWKIPEKE